MEKTNKAKNLVKRLQCLAVCRKLPGIDIVWQLAGEAADTIKRWEDIHRDDLEHTMREIEQLGIAHKVKGGVPVAVLVAAEIDRLKKLEKSVEGLRDCAHQEHFASRLNSEESRHLLNAFSYLNDRHDRGAPSRAGRDKLGFPTIEKPRQP